MRSSRPPVRIRGRSAKVGLPVVDDPGGVRVPLGRRGQGHRAHLQSQPPVPRLVRGRRDPLAAPEDLVHVEEAERAPAQIDAEDQAPAPLVEQVGQGAATDAGGKAVSLVQDAAPHPGRGPTHGQGDIAGVVGVQERPHAGRGGGQGLRPLQGRLHRGDRMVGPVHPVADGDGQQDEPDQDQGSDQDPGRGPPVGRTGTPGSSGAAWAAGAAGAASSLPCTVTS